MILSATNAERFPNYYYQVSRIASSRFARIAGAKT
jgi:hypothetical protein